MKRWLLLVLLILSRPVLADGGAAEHLLKGAQLFRAEQFSQALVEFKVAERLGGGAEAKLYAAATLVKLDRPQDAIEAFQVAEQATSAPVDALLTFYHALACYQARLYVCADLLLSAVGEQAGPRIGGEVRQMRSRLETLFSQEPSTESIDWYLSQGAEALRANRPMLAAAYFQEAVALSGRRKVPYRQPEATQALSSAISTTKHSAELPR